MGERFGGIDAETIRDFSFTADVQPGKEILVEQLNRRIHDEWDMLVQQAGLTKAQALEQMMTRYIREEHRRRNLAMNTDACGER